MHVFEENRDITSILRQENVAKFASKLSGLKETRDNLISLQRDLASDHGLVADGRDMGTHVFPSARTKIFLTANIDERTKRRYKQLKDKGMNVNLAAVSKEIKSRDRRDSERSVAPLVVAKDAKIIDTSDLSIDDATKIILKWFTDTKYI